MTTKTQLYARESVVFDKALVLTDTAGTPLDITGWTFTLSLARQAGAPDLSLDMAPLAGDGGFEISDGAGGILRMVIQQAALAGITDSTGDFTLFGDLLGTPPGGEARFVRDIRLNVTVAGRDFGGSTYEVVLDAIGTTLKGELETIRDEAQGAAAAALAAAGVDLYASTGAGLGGTAEGETFWVDQGDGTGIIYRHDAGPAATELGRFIKDPTGDGAAGLIGTAGGSNVQADLRKSAAYPPQRNLFEILAAQAGVLPATAVIERRRTDFIELGAAIPIEPSGMEWAYHIFGNRIEGGFAGGAAPCFNICVLAKLYATTSVAVLAATGAAGITAAAPTGTVDASAAARVGTWTGPVTVGVVTNVYWTATPGDTIKYQITVAAGEVHYHEFPENTANGGVVKVLVENAAVEIAPGDYLCPLEGGERIISERQGGASLGVAAMFRAPTAATYDVTLTLATSNPAGGRLYTRRVSSFAALTGASAPGAYGSVYANANPGETAARSDYPGTTQVLSFPNCTRIDFRYWKNPVCGQVLFKLFDSNGVEVVGLDITDLDMYGATSSTAVARVMDDLPQDDYTLHVFQKNTKNAAATAYRLYALRSNAVNQNLPGDPMVDDFDMLDCPDNPANAEDYGTHILFGPGNLNFAPEARKATEPAGVETFLSGPAHGFETAPTDWSLFLDGVNQTAAFNALPAKGKLRGGYPRITYSTLIKGPHIQGVYANTAAGLAATANGQYFATGAGGIIGTVGSQKAIYENVAGVATLRGNVRPPASSVALNALDTLGTLYYEDSFSAAGYRFRGRIAWSDNVVETEDHRLMLQVPSRKAGSKGAGGGMDRLAVSSEGNLTLDGHNDTTGQLAKAPDCFAYANAEYAVAAKCVNWPELASAFEDLSGDVFGNWNSYSTGRNKAYSPIIPKFSAGSTRAPGDGHTKEVLFRVFKGPQMGASVGLL